MKRNLHNIISGLAMVATLVMAGLLINPPVAANPVQTPIQDLTHSASLEFFNQGRHQFDREVELLINNSKPEVSSVLKISPEVLPQQQLLPLEQPQVVPAETQKSQAQTGELNQR
jgi:hypothetical protein